VDPVTQGKAAAFFDIQTVLSQPPEAVQQAFETVLKGANKT
jgi:hypothetical protein